VKTLEKMSLLIVGLGKLKEMGKQIAKARAYFEPEPIFIRPSAQWYATVDQVEKVGFKEAVQSKIPKKSKDDNTSCERNLSYIGSSKRMNASLRRVYRSMNVPVPRPLPSLLELMRSRKRIYSGACNV
ncbi:hypothetical protein HPP92_012960, partial [Vanilla planifolia]